MAKSATAQLMDDNGVAGKLKAWPQRTKGFFADVRNEMKKVSTPSLKEVRATTTVVLITVALFGVYFFLIDTVIAFGVNKLWAYLTAR